jgi:hypothetical protein
MKIVIVQVCSFTFSILSFFRLSLYFYVVKNKITVRFTCTCTRYYITRIRGHIKKHELCGPSKGFSRVILPISDIGFN